MITPLRERMLQERVLRESELEQKRIQSEIRRNDAEAKKMEAEAKKIDEPLLSKRNIIKYIFSVIKYSIAGVILSCLLFAFALDTGKNLYEITSNKIKENKENQKRISRENDKLKLYNDNLEKRSRELRKKVEESSEVLKIAEKHYLEIMMLSATAHAYNIYVQLVKRQEIYRPQGEEEKAQRAHSQACQFLHDYWKLVVKIAEETQADLFPEVKKEISDWLQKGEEENLFFGECRTEDDQQLLSPIQRKSLDLIERHVAQVRAGNSQFPDDLIDSFINQPEFQ